MSQGRNEAAVPLLDSSNASSDFEQQGTPVLLHIYDMHWANEYAHYIGMGAYHSGVEVYGKEYAYGAHAQPGTGVFTTLPLALAHMPQPDLKFRQTIHMGYTKASVFEVQNVAWKLGVQYQGRAYHLLTRNCNHFASDMVYDLVGKRSPRWVNTLAGLAAWVPCLVPGDLIEPPLAADPNADEDSDVDGSSNTQPTDSSNG
eukprot:Clim_evm5s212 gene=Clim_evmTU5s212